MNCKLATFAALLAMLGLRGEASPLDEGKVTRVVNEVRVLAGSGAAQRAGVDRLLRTDEKLRVGPHSRAEISISDGTLARLGAETVLGIRKATREVTLERGTLLLEVPPFRSSARVVAGSLVVVCGNGTILIEHLPGQSLKVVALAGEPRISSGGFFGDSATFAAGKMVIATPDAKLIPDPVDVDLRTLVKTSALVEASRFAAGSAPLRSLPTIERAIDRQAKAFNAKALIPTNLAIVGSGTNVVIPAAAANPITVEVPARVGDARRSESEKMAPKSVEIAALPKLQ